MFFSSEESSMLLLFNLTSETIRFESFVAFWLCLGITSLGFEKDFGNMLKNKVVLSV